MEKTWSVNIQKNLRTTWVVIIAVTVISFPLFWVFCYTGRHNNDIAFAIMTVVWLLGIIELVLKRFVYNISLDTSRAVLSIEKINLIKLIKKEDISLSAVNTEFIFGKIKRKSSEAFILKLIVQGKVRLQVKEGDDGWSKETLEEIHNYIEKLKVSSMRS
jgi:hypothetical protein